MDIYGVWVSVPVYKGPEGPREEEQVRVYGMYEMCGVVYVKGMYEGMLWLYQSTKDPKDRGKRSKYECISSSGTCADNPTCRKRKHGKKGRDRGWKT